MLTFAWLGAAGCGGAQPAAGGAAAESPPPESPRARRLAGGAIGRAELNVVLDAGLGRFLQGVETEPALEGRRFVGFRLVSLFPEDARIRAIDLNPGDVVMRVNGQAIERPEQVLRIWQGLRVASELVIEYTRDGAPHMLRFEIVNP